MTRIVFEEVKVSAKRSLTCKTCGKKFSRSKTFSNTINPWNQNLDGSVKTREQVRADVTAEANNWNPMPYCADSCTPKEG